MLHVIRHVIVNVVRVEHEQRLLLLRSPHCATMSLGLVEKAAPVFAFRVIPTTLLTLITYLSILIALIATDALPNVPENQGGLNINQAYEDLRQVGAPRSSHFLYFQTEIYNICRLRLTLILIILIRTMLFGLTSYPD